MGSGGIESAAEKAADSASTGPSSLKSEKPTLAIDSSPDAQFLFLGQEQGKELSFDQRRNMEGPVLSLFTEQNGTTERAFIERTLKLGVDLDRVSGPELQHKFEINNALGNKPYLTEWLFETDTSQVNPEKLAKELAESKARREREEQAAGSDTGKSTNTTTAETKQASAVVPPGIAKFMGDGPTVQKLISIEEADLDSIGLFLNGHGEAGKNSLVKLIDAGAHSQHLTEPGLSKFAELNSVWNPSVETTKKLLDKGPKVLEQISGLDRYIKEDPVPRSAEVEHLINSKAPIRHLNTERLEALRKLDRIFADTPEIIPKLLKAESHLNLVWLADHLQNSKEPGDLDRVVRLAKESPGSERLDKVYLKVLGNLSKYFEDDPDVLKRIESIAPPTLLQLNQYLSNDTHGQRIFKIRQLISEGASDALLAPERLKGIENINKATEHFDELKTRIMNAEGKGLNLKEVGVFLSNVDPSDMTKAASTLGQVIDHEPLAKVDSDYLTARLEFTDSKRIPPNLANRLLDLSSKGLNLGEVHNFIFKGSGPEAFERRIVEDQLNRNTDPHKLTFDRLRAIDRLYDMFDKDSVAKLLNYETERVSVTRIKDFALDGDENVRKLNSFLKESGPHRELDLQQLTDHSNLSNIEKYFPKDSETYKHLADLQRESLSTLRLANFIAEDKASRMTLLDMLAEDGADTQTFNTHMKLSVLPDSVAYDVVKAIDTGDIHYPTLLANMRSFEHGKTFTDFLTTHVRSGGDITQKAFDKLSDTAREEAERAKDVGSESASPTNQRARPSNIFDEDGLRETHLSPGNAKSNEKLSIASEALRQTAERIDTIIPADKTIVLLGRDTWPLVPLLKARGREVQYFMWTRLQNDDQATMNQWLKEVPPNSAVVDTGFMGTIFDAIGKIDPSATGYLMNSLTHYQQLLPYSSSEKVVTIEDIPKMIGRSSSYTASGNAISRQEHRDDGDRPSSFAYRNQHRWQVEKETEKLLRQLGLSEWDVWRYRDYVGLTPRERLGYDSNEAVGAHYDRVAKERAISFDSDTPTIASTESQPPK